VVQLYVGYPEARVERPVKELKGFAKVHLEPGECCRVAFALPARHLAYYLPERKAWGVEPAAYTVLIGPSSAEEDLLHGTFRVE
jgi:beta-glucosidase